jgi:AcrR family transcriptional regulator
MTTRESAGGPGEGSGQARGGDPRPGKRQGQPGVQRGEPREQRGEVRGRRGLRRGDLTRELIVRESLRLLDTEGLAGFSLPKLGRALGADPTAVYRHFASKDDLVLAIADRLIEEAAAGLTPGDCWVATVTEIARRLRAAYLAHPAAASLSCYRTTQGPAEMRAVNILIGAVLAAGFEGAEAATVYRAVGDFCLFWAGGEAAFLALDEQVQKNDTAAWTRAYLAVDRGRYPHTWTVRTELPEARDDDIFETILSIVVGGLAGRAPRPCGCGRHA